jgi:hypothetical protein
MALPTYLSLVNDILVRMREPEVSTVQENTLSKLIGKLVNDAKRQVEDAYTWSALTATKSISTVADTSSYSITGTGSRFKVLDGYNTTDYNELKPTSSRWMDRNLLAVSSVSTGSPGYYVFKGVDSSGDAKVTVFPVPDAVYGITWNMYIPQEALSADSDTMLVPSEPVILGAFARALVERGEDGGLNSSEAYGLYKSSLADAIAIESSRYIEEDAWEAV